MFSKDDNKVGPYRSNSPVAKRVMKAMAFKNIMVDVLLKPENRAKGDWKDIPQEKLVELLDEEIREFKEALKNGTPMQINSEAADVANFLMMICDNVIELEY